jgi:hypothetical protein
VVLDLAHLEATNIVAPNRMRFPPFPDADSLPFFTEASKSVR